MLPDDRVVLPTSCSILLVHAPGFAQLDGAAEIGGHGGLVDDKVDVMVGLHWSAYAAVRAADRVRQLLPLPLQAPSTSAMWRPAACTGQVRIAARLQYAHLPMPGHEHAFQPAQPGGTAHRGGTLPVLLRLLCLTLDIDLWFPSLPHYATLLAVRWDDVLTFELRWSRELHYPDRLIVHRKGTPGWQVRAAPYIL